MDLSLKNQPRTSVKTQVFSVIITLIADSLDESLTQYFRFWRTTGFFPLGSHRSSSFVWEEQLSRKNAANHASSIFEKLTSAPTFTPFLSQEFLSANFRSKGLIKSLLKFPQYSNTSRRHLQTNSKLKRTLSTS